MPDPLALRDFANHLADLADALTLPAFHAAMEVGTKADGTVVTATDLAVERALRAAILERFPGHAILGEEDGRQGPDGAPMWILDPIDGTRNFVNHLPVYATLIALEVNGVETVGIVSAPALGSRWDAVRGGVARQDGRPIRVSDHRSLADAQVSFGGLNHFARRGLGDLPARLATVTSRQRGFGDFWHHCLVASGAIDVAIEAEVNHWDLAAVKCIVETAGGRFTDLDGHARADSGTAISSNGHVHDQVLALVHA